MTSISDTPETFDTGIAAPVPRPYVQFQSVQKTYDGETLIVKDLNLDIAEGEFLTMLGPSGSGKSTCLMMLAGFETPTHGEITLGGKPISKISPWKRDIGVVFQTYALFPHMTVAENLAFPLKMRGMNRSDSQKKVQRALEMVQLGDFAGRYPAQMSGGQKQRVAVARALVFDPKLVLMDEPLGALDKQLREQMQYEIKHLHEQLGLTMVYVTHDQSEALTMSDRVAVFDKGIIQQLATPQELYERPQNAFVAQFIGENNRFLGQIKSSDGSACEVVLDDGSHVRALAVNAGQPGERTTLSLRPERVTVSPPDGAFPNEFEARAEELIYLGDHIRARLSLCGHDDFIVKIPNASEHPPIAEGATVHVGWQVADCRALDGPA